MNDYLYFANNSKDMKDHIKADMTSCKIFFQLMVSFLRKTKVIAASYILR